MRAEGLTFTIVYMLYDASCRKQFIPLDELREVFDEGEMSTLIKLLRDLRIIVSRREYIETIKYVKAKLGLPKEDDSVLTCDSLADDGIIALNPALIDEIGRNDGKSGSSYQMIRSFITDLLGSLELTANVGSLNELVKDMALKHEESFRVAVAKDIIINHACNLSDVEKASLAAAKLVSPPRFSGVISILLSRARKLAERVSLELSEEDVESYLLRGFNGNSDAESRAHVSSLD
ncbi:MAG: hypothetical protein WED04_10630 [Promethearchaeati archaeon SRVP18_Atabeyarchaeia-1]